MMYPNAYDTEIRIAALQAAAIAFAGQQPPAALVEQYAKYFEIHLKREK